MLRFGWKAGAEQFPPTQLLDFVIAAEGAGFDLVDVSDHFHPWSEAGQAPFVWTWLGAAAARTGRIHLGPGLTCPILRYHPAVIAQAAATVASLAPGRVYLAVGTGEALNEYSSTARWPGYRERQARLAEAIDLIRALWSGEEVTFRGTFYQTRKARLYTLPDVPIPLYVSSLAPGSAAFAGKHGDGLLTVGGQNSEVYEQIIARFESGAREAGKDPSRMPRLVEIGAEFTDDADGAAVWRRQYWAATFLPALFNQKIYTPTMAEQNGAAVGADTVKERVCISTDPDVHVRFCQRYVDLGFDHLIFHSAAQDQRTFLEPYAREVLPRLRQKPS
jgi:coenzyme F420-dependent glucose-6-phosphate dehydrogenase